MNFQQMLVIAVMLLTVVALFYVELSKLGNVLNQLILSHNRLMDRVKELEDQTKK